LGRQLYPQLDLWASAQPFLERWVRQRYSPKGLYKQLKNHAPDWLEQLPQVPPMIFKALESAQRDAPTPLPSEPRPNSRRRWVGTLGIGLLLVGLVGINPALWQSLQQAPALSLATIALGALILVLR
jgi:ubiquinone biosynthesis protein